MARRYLAIPATSAPIERTFSIGSNIISKSRNRLEPETVKQIVLLRSWKIKALKELEDNYRNSAIIEDGNEGEE
jgi:hAT family protein